GSAKPKSGEFSYTVGGYVDALAGWLDALGIARAVLTGNGIGGAVALRYASAHPQRALGLALLAPVGFAEQSRTLRLVSRLLGTPPLRGRRDPVVTSLALGQPQAAPSVPSPSATERCGRLPTTRPRSRRWPRSGKM